MTKENPEHAEDRSRRQASRILKWVVLLLSFYLLSPGPVWYCLLRHEFQHWKGMPKNSSELTPLTDNGVNEVVIFGTVYMPIWWTAEHCPPVGRFYEWYMTIFHTAASNHFRLMPDSGTPTPVFPDA